MFQSKYGVASTLCCLIPLMFMVNLSTAKATGYEKLCITKECIQYGKDYSLV